MSFGRNIAVANNTDQVLLELIFLAPFQCLLFLMAMLADWHSARSRTTQWLTLARLYIEPPYLTPRHTTAHKG